MGLGDFLEAFENRVKSPIFGSFAFSFIGFNWRELFYLFFNKSATVTERIGYFDKNTDVWSLLVFPLGTGLILALGMPHINVFLAKAVSGPKKKRTALNHAVRLANAESLKLTLEAEDSADEEGFRLRKSQRRKEEEADIAEFEARRIQRTEEERIDVEKKKKNSEARREKENTAIENMLSGRNKEADSKLSVNENSLMSRMKKLEEEVKNLVAEKTNSADSLKSQSQTKTIIPTVDEEDRENAERDAIKLLNAGKTLPLEVGYNVREIGKSGAPVSLRKFSQLKNCPYLIYARLDQSKATDFHELSKHKHLKLLTLSYTKLEDLKPIAELNELELLYIQRTLVSDLTPLIKLANLDTLDLDHSKVTDLSPLSKLKKLERIWVHGLDVTDWSPLNNIDDVSGGPED